jgi:Protein of unknown function (DUF3093)
VPNPKPTEPIVYRERVRPNLGTFIAVATLLPAVTLVSEPFDYRIGIAVGLILVISIWAALFFLAPVIQVGGSHLTVAHAKIPRNLLGKIEVIAKDQIFSERGPKLDPAAYKVFQGTVKTAIKISLNDPNDPTPYWIISTRKPAQLAEVLRAKN